MVYRASTLRGLAVAQMVFGALMIVFGVACIFAAHHWSSYVGFGVWVGFWVFVTGILGYTGARDDSTPSKCLIGCFMGFSITACVITGVMFICYCVTLSQYSKFKQCRDKYNYGPYNSYWTDCYSLYEFKRATAANVAGLGTCLLLFSLVEFFLALASSIYCCTAVCCSTPSGVVTSAVTNQQVMYVQPQYMYPGAQPGVVLMQTSGNMVTVPQRYPVTGQAPVYFPQQAGMAVQQPAYWAVPSGSNPAGTVTVSYAGATGPQVQNQAQVQIPVAPKDDDRPPPYSFTQTANVPPPAFSTSAGTNPTNVNV